MQLPPRRLETRKVIINMSAQMEHTFVIRRQLHGRQGVQILATLCEKIIPPSRWNH